MIPHNFAYMQPTSLEAAFGAYRAAAEAGKSPVYYAGGTEVISYARQGNIAPGAVIDLKRVPECLVRDTTEDGMLAFGACLTLNQVVAGARFPLLSQAAHIIDHTIRNRLTLGGNITGRLPYRETVLPFLVAEGVAVLYGPEGERSVPLMEIFRARLRLKTGEILVQLRVPQDVAKAPWHYERRVKHNQLDYPIVTGCFLRAEEEIRMALTGVVGFPLRSTEAEAVLNDASIPVEQRPAQALAALSFDVIEDQRAAADYRRALTEMVIGEALAALGGAQ
jgi:CO/xanthine dehydrogenase FAD-binding subunit